MPVRARALDHVVINASDVAGMLAWYRDRLGLEPLRVDEWQRGETYFPSLRIDETTIIDIFPAERTGENVNHVCLVVDDVDLDELAASGEFEVVSGPGERWGARGNGRSLYVLDPEGNTVELRTY